MGGTAPSNPRREEGDIDITVSVAPFHRWGIPGSRNPPIACSSRRWSFHLADLVACEATNRQHHRQLRRTRSDGGGARPDPVSARQRLRHRPDRCASDDERGLSRLPQTRSIRGVRGVRQTDLGVRCAESPLRNDHTISARPARVSSDAIKLSAGSTACSQVGGKSAVRGRDGNLHRERMIINGIYQA